jgi:hypothetical protein
MGISHDLLDVGIIAPDAGTSQKRQSPTPNAAKSADIHQRSIDHAGHRAAARTAACTARLGGGPAHDDRFHPTARACEGSHGCDARPDYSSAPP